MKKLLINWNDMKCIIDDVEYKIEIVSTIYHDIEEYIEEYPYPIYYRKDDLILENDSIQYYLLEVDKNDKIIERWKLHEITD